MLVMASNIPQHCVLESISPCKKYPNRVPAIKEVMPAVPSVTEIFLFFKIIDKK